MGKNRLRIIKTAAAILILSIFILIYQYIAGPVVIEMAIYSGNSWGIPQNFAYAIYDKAAEMYLADPAHKNIRIKYKTGTMYNHYSEWLAQLVLKGKEPDVFLLVEEDFNTYASIDLLQNLNHYIEKDPDFNEEAYYPRALEAGVFNGNQYSLPISLVPSFMIVNKTLLSRNNIEIDREHWNWDQFYEICRLLTKDTDNDSIPDTFGIYGYDWHHAFYTNDRYLFYPDAPRIGFDNDRMSETLNFLKKMNKLNQGRIISDNDFEDGNAGFKIFNFSEYKVYGTYPYRILKYENFTWEAIPLPEGPHGRNSSKLYTLQVGMSSRTRHKDEAFEFIKFLTNNELFQKEVWNGTNTLPANRHVVNDIYSQNQAELEEMKILSYPLLNSIIQSSYVDPDFKWYASMDKFIGQRMFQIIVQELNTKQGVKELRKDIEKNLKEYREL
ncbi:MULTISPECIES: ABC transporter substrate-binding protein [unclassified Oceanispirochaeta]|uniref:ABC transporter substrate-binding protein n=1 Tax=unclassified Oceanispirochaeta TaxID=2635722 RepID=UPI000E0934DD|nr:MULTISPECIES: extracellular solute-binding protein [unclassified Oceanispirochaeta]MBF9014608.1 extracellular solute-binding protein [Oceanispirochaeta sp. M2]NPD70864.1 extracellular solute-binding protein [Oceanispirochaeta sp. M1]RDG34143.1 extracellular solute-binding protein [Oceanispirochaeta sp. M1]